MRMYTPKAYVFMRYKNKPLPNYHLTYYWWDNKHYLKVQIPCDCDCHTILTFGHSFGNCCNDGWITLTKLKFTSI